jgi:ADP-ribose pyrophosphatase YjhB (NUDIX family)
MCGFWNNSERRINKITLSLLHGLCNVGVRGYPAIVLMRKSSKQRNHAEQWALPSCRMEPGESPEETVLREVEEEVGLKRGFKCILGRLDDYRNRSGFTIKPIEV